MITLKKIEDVDALAIFLTVLSIIGILIIIFGNAGIGVLFLCPAVITIIVKIAIKIAKEMRINAELERVGLEREVRWQEQRERQNMLIEQYKCGQLVHDVINTICAYGSGRVLPYDIYIHDEYISSSYKMETREYIFYKHRVRNFEEVCVHSKLEADNAVKPQIAMAIALNYHLDNNYDINDNGYSRDYDGYDYNYYSSHGVHMRIKPTKSY